MPRIYYFLTLTGHVSERASLASLVVALRSRSSGGLELVDFDEPTRRIVLRFAPTEIAFVKTLLGSYIDSATFEVKAKTRMRLSPKQVRAAGGVAEQAAGRLLALIPCRDGMVFAEQKGRELLLKYCVKPSTQAVLLPASLPPSLCSFNPLETDVTGIYERGRRCIEEVVERLGAGTG